MHTCREAVRVLVCITYQEVACTMQTVQVMSLLPMLPCDIIIVSDTCLPSKVLFGSLALNVTIQKYFFYNFYVTYNS